MIFYIISYQIAIYRPFQQNVTKMRYDIWYFEVYDINGGYQVKCRPISGDIRDISADIR